MNAGLIHMLNLKKEDLASYYSTRNYAMFG